MTGLPFDGNNLIPNHILRAAIEDWKARGDNMPDHISSRRAHCVQPAEVSASLDKKAHFDIKMEKPLIIL